MSISNAEVTAIGQGIGVLILLYAAYWALNIRHALAVNVYRKQALGIGLVAISCAILGFGQVLPIVNISFLEGFGPGFLVLLVLFYWIDASMISARRSDPLLRDSLHWSKLRIVLWILIVALMLIGVILLIPKGTPSGLLLGPLFLVALGLLILVPLSGALSLSVALRRSKDIAFRRHLKWFAVFAVLFFFVFPLGANIASYALIFAAGYSLYRSARSLAPLNKISL